MKRIRIGTFNVDNLFERPRIMELEGFSQTGKAVLKDVSDLEALLENSSYAGNVGNEIVKILNKYYHDLPSNPWFRINEIRKKLFSIKQAGSPTDCRQFEEGRHRAARNFQSRRRAFSRSNRANAQKVSARRIALAGYRLAAILNKVL